MGREGDTHTRATTSTTGNATHEISPLSASSTRDVDLTWLELSWCIGHVLRASQGQRHVTKDAASDKPNHICALGGEQYMVDLYRGARPCLRVSACVLLCVGCVHRGARSREAGAY